MDSGGVELQNHFFKYQGLRLRYVEQGVGPAVIMLHGASLGSSADVFLRNLPLLAAKGYRAIAYDQPGFGLSENPADFGLEFRQNSILGLMEELHLEKATLVGHSQAGNFAFNLGFQQPKRINHVVILGTGTLLPPLPDGEGSKKGPVEGREGTPQEPDIDATRKLLASNLFQQELITNEELALRHNRSIGKNFKAFLERGRVPRKIKKAVDPPWGKLAASPVPILLIYGREERANAFERATLLKKQYPSLNLHIVKNCKHLVPWDAAERWVNLAADFFQNNDQID